jgi:hypothetical protein
MCANRTPPAGFDHRWDLLGRAGHQRLDVPSRLEAMPATQLAAYGRAASAPAGMLPWREQVLRTQPTALAPIAKLRMTVATKPHAAAHSAKPKRKSARSCGKHAVRMTIAIAPTTVPIMRNEPLRSEAPRLG